MKKKLLNKKGFSISELLMVVLVLSLIVCILGGGVIVVKNAYVRVTLKAEALTLLSTTITKVTDEFRFADMDGVEQQAGNPVGFVSANEGCLIYLENDTSADNRGILVSNGFDTAALLSDKTMSSGLVSKLGSGGYTYNEETGMFEAEIIVVKMVDGSEKTMASQNIKVRTINP